MLTDISRYAPNPDLDEYFDQYTDDQVISAQQHQLDVLERLTDKAARLHRLKGKIPFFLGSRLLVHGEQVARLNQQIETRNLMESPIDG